MKNITLTVDGNGKVTLGDKLKVGRYSVRVIHDPFDPDAQRRFYRSQVLPHITYCIIDYTGTQFSEDSVHQKLRQKCNGGRSTSKMTGIEWRRYLHSLKAYTIDKLGADWPF